MDTTYARLTNPHEWGLRIRGEAKPGQTVTVKTKAGKTKTEIVGRIVWSGQGKDGGPMTLATIKKDAKEQAGEPGPKADLQTQCLCQKACCNGQCHCQASCPCITGVICEEVPF